MIQDYGFRLYNPAIAKFLSVDPLAPEYPWYTPYQFAGNMPIRYIDLDGLEPADPQTNAANSSSEWRNSMNERASSLEPSIINEGLGITENQFFTLNGETTKEDFDRLKFQYARDPSILNNNALATYYPLGENFETGQNLEVGDNMYIDITGPLNGYVRFTSVFVGDNSFSIEGQTLQGSWLNPYYMDGHPDNGTIRFTGTFDQETSTANIQIWNTTKAGSYPTYLGGPANANLNAGRLAQKAQWRTVINNIQNFMNIDDENTTRTQFILRQVGTAPTSDRSTF